MSNSGAENFQVQVQWFQDPTAVPAPVNQFMIQPGPGVAGENKPDLYTMTFGHVTPPVIPAFNSLEEAQAFGAGLSAVVAPVARLSFTPGRLRELHDLIGQVLEQGNQA